ncbi:monovalent cation:proton antiporter-2 (CPA2) family protein [Hoeflea prorocentri]|uniref:Monovalent cation:proton antiporter-2 (CPA2) family protein n=1 Tax=Hoeflea prorocentri TaxID=1922333 RepID=A0A9X3UIQ9_9HYPH|nr:monovalent cation:proton antiporter-2 (CPA2) family protein [Hoeflea prorocentri]MCY6382082.1 monovalent cation:proton antiporter-2 (CPA2) family protein [Hoeflea prorocentri]MDA5399882.1 monovalent cation:proton antiporter-2 (CPA2) family protein [Hoeflea prorocentri]
MTGLLFQAFVYLCAAVIAVPVAKRLGLGSVLGYLIAGIVIGPVLGLVGSETEGIQHIAEFGVVMMLFLVGLELEPRTLWTMRNKLLGLGGLQVGVTIVLVMAAAMALGQPATIALAIGLVFSLSSTAIVLQTLNEKGLMKSDGGQSSFSVLLFQDIAVIPMLALIPLLALPELAHHGDGHGGGHGAEFSLIEGLAGWQVAIVNIAAIAAVIAGGHYLSRPMFRFIAASKLREIFTAAALLLVVAIAFLMTLVGLSPALGTFLAGVVLANSEFRHELESDIEPFKGLLLGLFFITVGAGIDFTLLFNNAASVFGLTIGLMVLKAAVLLGLAYMFKLRGADQWLFTLALAQAGEFGFVLLSFTVQNSVIPTDLADLLLLVVALSMLLTPALFILFDRVVLPRMDKDQGRDADEITEKGAAIICGMGRFGQVINRVLKGNGYETVVLDLSAETVDGFNRFGIRTFYGDASRPDLLGAAGLEEAGLLVVAIDDMERALEIVKHARRERPDLHIVARARNRHHVYEFYKAGADDIVRETFDSAVRASRYALEAFGIHPHEAEKLVTMFENHDRDGIRRLARLYDPDIPAFENEPYMKLAREIQEEMEDALSDRPSVHDEVRRAWLPPGAKAQDD